MKKLLFGLALILLSSCSKTTNFPNLAQVTKVQIVGQTSRIFPFRSKVWWITNKNHIARIVAFVDKQQYGWSPPFLTPPAAPDTALVFLNGKVEQRVFGIGSNFFTAHGKGEWILKNVSQQEKQELLDIIGPLK